MNGPDKNIKIILLDDDLYYRMALEKQLKNTIDKLPLKNLYRFTFHVFSNPQNLLNELKSDLFDNARIIAYIDYYLGKGVNGGYILKYIDNHKSHINTILISQSHYVGEEVKRESFQNLDIDFIEKNNYSLTMCSILFEQFIENASSIIS